MYIRIADRTIRELEKGIDKVIEREYYEFIPKEIRYNANSSRSKTVAIVLMLL